MSHPCFRIANRNVGLDFDPLVIAELGINHEGDLRVALQMVDAAIAAGAEVIKHQTHVIDDEMSPAARAVIPGNSADSIYEIMQRCSLSEDDERQLKEYVESKGACFVSTPFSRAAADRLERMGVAAYKIGSGECNNYPLLEHVSRFGKPVILSTGMNDIPSIGVAVDIFRAYGIPFALLHCTNVYPTPDRLVRLGCIEELQRAFPDAVIGLSDHTVDNLACLAGVACGASILERHFTDLKSRPGPDIVCSMDPGECRALITQSRRVGAMRGGRKGAVPEEAATIAFAYASVVSVRPIARGEVYSYDNVWVKRPGTGDFLAKDLAMILGRVATRDIPADEQLKKTDVA